jgi:hypothetical protein
MAPVNHIDPMRASPSVPAGHDKEDGADDPLALDDLEEELKRLSAVNEQLLEEFQQTDVEPSSAVELATPHADADELKLLRQENAALKARLQELEALGAGQGEELWLERQREYEVLVEEKSEVIRGLHQKIQEAQQAQESAIGVESAPAGGASCSGTRLGQAEEILRLKRELEQQRRQLEQDEQDMMAQMRQMEMTMAKERAGLARQQQEVQRLQADLAREIENSSRDPELRERLHSLRRAQESKPAPAAVKTAQPNGQANSGFFRRIFG